MSHPGFRLSSPDFGENEYLPFACGRQMQDQPPPLRWAHAPEGTQSFVLRVDDLDAPDGIFTHWVVYDLPRDATGLDPGDRKGGVEGRNDFQTVGWGGPMPPPGHGDHRYVFTLSALDRASLDLAPGAKPDEVAAKMQGHVLGEAKLTGQYRRD